MSDRGLAIAALVVAVFAVLLIAFHAMLPTPPAHTSNGLYDRYLRLTGGSAPGQPGATSSAT